MKHKILAISEKSLINKSVDDAALNLMHEVAAHTCQRAQTLLLKPTFTQLALAIGRSLLFTLPNEKIQNTIAWAELILEKYWRNLHA